jgi:DUF4097 and DUF4098 domain-containing protein YvlB
VLAILPLLLATGCDEIGSDEPIEQHDDSFSVSGPVVLDVETFNGSITITAGTANTVRVQATLKRADRIDYEAKQTSGAIEVRADEKGSTIGRSPSAAVEITAPVGSRVELRTSNGSITVTGLESDGNLRTSNGRITVRNMNGELNAETSNGSIEVREFSGSVILETSNGSIRFAGELVVDRENEMTTSNGSVTVDLEGEPSLELDARTSNGGVSSDHEMLVTSSGEGRLVGTIGNGDASLRIRSSNGSISLR